MDSESESWDEDAPWAFDQTPPDGDDTAWAALRSVVGDLQLEHIEAIEFVSTFRGPQIGAGRKSVTMRLRFRAPNQTLVHESVDVQVNAVIGALETGVGAEIRR